MTFGFGALSSGGTTPRLFFVALKSLSIAMTAPERQTSVLLPRQEGGLRYVVESFISLAMAVLLVRSFAVEGYIISTGSMAPYLLGYHKQVVCPDCRFPFAVGVPVDEGHDTKGPVPCPNCGQAQIDLEHVPRNEGDQLLVQKLAYLFRQPKRWEVVVFQNPSRPVQAYVKRVIGLPGEAIQVVAGDVWINGELVRKNLAEQRSTRMAICSQQHRPDGWDDLRWQTDEPWETQSNGFDLNNPKRERGRTLPATSNSEHSGAITFAHASGDEEDSSAIQTPLAWVNYRGDAPLRDGTKTPTIRGQQWPADDYAYNGLSERSARYWNHDLMTSMQIELHSGRGEFVLAMHDGWQAFEFRLSAGERELQLYVSGNDEPLQVAKFAGQLWRRPMLLEMSLFDRQLLVAIDGKTIFSQNLSLRTNDGLAAGNSEAGPVPVRFGARDLHLSVRDLTLYRDVYYTRGDARNGIKEPYQLGDDEYFFLGDNSPVSLDSRSWPDAVVQDHMLLGKPFMVHLPSRPGRIKLGPAEWHIRVPDWGRIRYIR